MQPPQAQQGVGVIIGAAIGGALAVIAVIGVAIRLKVVSAQLNDTHKVSSWRTKTKANSKPTANPIPFGESIENPAFTLRVNRTNSLSSTNQPSNNS